MAEQRTKVKILRGITFSESGKELKPLQMVSWVRSQHSVKAHTIGMFVVGAIVWVLYLIYANGLTLGLGVNHFAAEMSGIPLSWVINYAINTRLNFDLPFSLKRFGMFCLISAGGWVVYELTTLLFTDVFNVYSLVGTLVGVGTKTIMNVILQQAITFGIMARGVRKGAIKAKATRPDYDWNSYIGGNPIQRYWKHQIVGYTMQMVKHNPILDCGCGSSPLLALIEAKVKFGVDTNLDKIKFMRKTDISSTYLWYDGGMLPFGDGRFETVICNEVIEHHPRPDKLVKELSRVARSKATVIISTPDYASIRWNIIEVIYGLAMHTGYELEHGSKFTQSSLVALCNAFGLELKRVERVAKCDMVCQFEKV